MFLDYCELLNSFDSGTTTKITINNRRMNKHDFEQSILLPMQEDGLDLYRKEYNDMLLEKVTGANSMVQEKYATVSVCKKYHFDMEDTMRKGHSFKDFICPDSFEFEKDHFKMGNQFGRVLFLREYASYIKDVLIAELTDFNRNLIMSIDVIPIPTDEAVREVETRLLGVETSITNWQRRQNANNNFSAVVPYDMEQQRKESKEFLDALLFQNLLSS